MVTREQIRVTTACVVSPVRRRETRARLLYENRDLYQEIGDLKEFVHRPSSVLAHILEHVSVAPQGHGGIGVTKHLRDRVEGDTLSKCQSSSGVSEIVKAHLGRETSLLQEAS